MHARIDSDDAGFLLKTARCLRLPSRKDSFSLLVFMKTSAFPSDFAYGANKDFDVCHGVERAEAGANTAAGEGAEEAVSLRGAMQTAAHAYSEVAERLRDAGGGEVADVKAHDAGSTACITRGIEGNAGNRVKRVIQRLRLKTNESYVRFE